MSITTITEENYTQQVLESPQPVLLDFWADWCGPCRAFAPVLEEVARERPDIRVGKIHVDEQSALAQQFQIGSVPTLIVMKHGTVTARKSGVLPKADVLKLL